MYYTKFWQQGALLSRVETYLNVKFYKKAIYDMISEKLSIIIIVAIYI